VWRITTKVCCLLSSPPPSFFERGTGIPAFHSARCGSIRLNIALAMDLNDCACWIRAVAARLKGYPAPLSSAGPTTTPGKWLLLHKPQLRAGSRTIARPTTRGRRDSAYNGLENAGWSIQGSCCPLPSPLPRPSHKHSASYAVNPSSCALQVT
jgi:hypothetical protein